MPCEFKFNYFLMKIASKLQLKNKLSIYPEITSNYPKINFHIKKLKTRV